MSRIHVIHDAEVASVLQLRSLRSAPIPWLCAFVELQIRSFRGILKVANLFTILPAFFSAVAPRSRMTS